MGGEGKETEDQGKGTPAVKALVKEKVEGLEPAQSGVAARTRPLLLYNLPGR